MSDLYGSDFMTIVDEDGTEYELEVLTTVEYNGNTASKPYFFNLLDSCHWHEFQFLRNRRRQHFQYFSEAVHIVVLFS